MKPVSDLNFTSLLGRAWVLTAGIYLISAASIQPTGASCIARSCQILQDVARSADVPDFKPVRAATTQVTNTASIVMLLQAFFSQATSYTTIPAIAGEPLQQWMGTHAALTKADG